VTGTTEAIGDLIGRLVPPPFSFVRIVNGPDGRARIERMAIGATRRPDELDARFRTLWRSRASAISVNAIRAGDKIPYHNAVDTGAGVLLLVLKGLAVLWVDDDGEAGKSYYPQTVGSVFLCEDAKGRGHGGIILEDAVVMHISLAPEPILIPGLC